ncbi:PAS domain S-box-containing protein/diguanylate cyclase (GGDEF) domain-containing protein [Pseudoduganella namucuonensis]|uniref:PAS domain S-box-containing protein/diguanylate cyclase (GGDEF) domain-containing protein n=2 Tax=Pseudoduganella namucuonensis TaxID=1035707 RepID=A0A1I7IIR4_9BURK|nr:PAS domain S-box-containing protein/diguanylate cyclase (GGDEF) domain-containing protein [Pseudoduganella namucuonensis]
MALALLSGLGVTALLFSGVSRLEHDKVALAFQQRAGARLFQLQQGVGGAIASVGSVNQLFASREHVSRKEFELFTRPILRQHPYIQGISHLRLLSHAERAAFEADMARLLPGTVVTELRDGRPVPAGARPRYRVVDYVVPLAGNEAALGLDTAYPVHDEAARARAYATGQPSASDLVRLAQGPAPRVGVVVSMPVYRHGAALDGSDARLAALEGETAAVLRPSDMIASLHAAGQARMAGHAGMDLRVYAAAGESPDKLVFHAPPPAAPARDTLPGWLYPTSGERVAQPFDVAGKTWLMVARQPGGALVEDHLASIFTLGLGAILSVLGAAYVNTLASRNHDVQRRVDERTAQLKQLNREMLLRDRAIESSVNAIIITAALPGNPTVYVNPAFERLTGYGGADMLGRSPRALYRDDLDQPGVAEVRAAIREQRDGHAVVRCYRKDGAMFWNELHISPVRDEHGGVTHFVCFQHDITAIKAYESELRHQATHDALTGLPNRVLLQDRLHQTITHSSRKGHRLWVVSIDLDRFKFTNSRLGHKGGDRLLRAVGERLQLALRPVDTVARIGGDEFALMLLPEQGSLTPRADQVQRVLDCLAAPLHIDGQELFLTCSAGIAVYPEDSAETGPLMERADIAMYRAKEMGGNNYQFYTAAMNERLGERMLIENALRTALERREFVLHYQPQVDIASGRIVGLEALIRWQHPELGMVAPNRFIPLAEETGLILPVGAWVLRTACEQLMAWRADGRRDLRVAVNVSARQMAEQDFVQSVADVLAATGVPPHCIELELTESQVMSDVEHAIAVMHELKKLGVQLAIDDFGTGYSSLAHLKRFEVDVLKIDQTFVRDLTVDPDDAAIVTTIIALAANLGLEVISEGVETREQLAFLRQHGCQQMQGYYFSRPLPAAALEAVLRDNDGLFGDLEHAGAERTAGQAT